MNKQRIDHKNATCLLIWTISLIMCCNVGAQDIIYKKGVLQDIPYSNELPYIRPYALSTTTFKTPYCYVHDRDYQLRVYRDFQQVHFFEKEAIMDEKLYAKFHIPGSSKSLYAIEAYSPEYESDELIIVDENGTICDRMRNVRQMATPWILSRQYFISDFFEIVVYSVIPESEGLIDLVEFGMDPAATVIARIQRDEYIIQNDRFLLKNTSKSDVKTIRSGDFTRESCLWSMFEVK